MLWMFPALLVAPLDSSTSSTPIIDIPRLEAEVEIDGVLDEAVWSRAIVLDGFSQYLPVDGRPAEDSTSSSPPTGRASRPSGRLSSWVRAGCSISI